MSCCEHSEGNSSITPEDWISIIIIIVGAAKLCNRLDMHNVNTRLLQAEWSFSSGFIIGFSPIQKLTGSWFFSFGFEPISTRVSAFLNCALKSSATVKCILMAKFIQGLAPFKYMQSQLRQSKFSHPVKMWKIWLVRTRYIFSQHTRRFSCPRRFWMEFYETANLETQSSNNHTKSSKRELKTIAFQKRHLPVRISSNAWQFLHLKILFSPQRKTFAPFEPRSPSILTLN